MEKQTASNFSALRSTANHEVMPLAIDEAVYELYGLTEDEIKIVENSSTEGGGKWRERSE